MHDLIRFLLAIAFLILLGALALYALGLRGRRAPLHYAQPALDFAFGAALLPIVWICLAPLGWRVGNLVPYMAAAAAAIGAIIRKASSPAAAAPRRALPRARHRWLAALVLLLLAVVLFGIGARAFSTPMYCDGRYIWAFKSKAMFSDGRLDRTTFSSLARYRYTALDHPLALPAAEALLYQSLGRIDERFAKLVGVLYLVGIAVLLAAYLRRRLSWSLALGVSALACAAPVAAFYAGAGGADVPLAFHFLAAAVLLAEYAEAGRPQDGALSALVFGAAGLVKSEGLTMALGGALALALVWWRQKQTRTWAQVSHGVAALLLPVLPWAALRAYWQIPSPQVSAMQLRGWDDLLSRVVVTVQQTWHSAFNWKSWEAAWFLVALGFTVWLLSRGRPRSLAFLWFLLAWQSIADFAVYAMNPYDINWTLFASLDRLLLQLLPLGLAAAVSSLAACGGERTEPCP